MTDCGEPQPSVLFKDSCQSTRAMTFRGGKCHDVYSA